MSTFDHFEIFKECNRSGHVRVALAAAVNDNMSGDNSNAFEDFEVGGEQSGNDLMRSGRNSKSR